MEQTKKKPTAHRPDRINKLDSGNAQFFEKNGFLGLKLTDNGNEQVFELIFLHRIFPFEKLFEYISVLDENSSEIGIIYDICDFSDATRQLLKTELERRYYAPQIKSIASLKERYGFSYWKIITTDERNISFTMQDTFKNMIRIGDDKAILLDVDGNRFVIESIAALDRKSHKKIEIYL